MFSIVKLLDITEELAATSNTTQVSKSVTNVDGSTVTKIGKMHFLK